MQEKEIINMKMGETQGRFEKGKLGMVRRRKGRRKNDDVILFQLKTNL